VTGAHWMEKAILLAREAQEQGEVSPGVPQSECVELLKDFFRSRRT